MPIYEFKCKKCGYEFERLFLCAFVDNSQIDTNNSSIECPKCGSEETEKKIVRIAVSKKECGNCGGCRGCSR